MHFRFREAGLSDIPQLHTIRLSVRQNRLSDPNKIQPSDYEQMINRNGKGWVCEEGNEITGFAFADLSCNNVWALFVHPQWEGKGIGNELHKIMLDWYFSKTDEALWLSTAAGTRSEVFYRKRGWTEIELQANQEIKFEMSRDTWYKLSSDQ